MTTVVNIHRERGRMPAFDVYIGRACPRAADPRCRVTSEWCNCFRVGRDVKTVEESLRRYERMLREYLARNPDAVPRLLALRGKRLGCWCTPDPCHGDVLVRVIEEVYAAAPAEACERVARCLRKMRVTSVADEFDLHRMIGERLNAEGIGFDREVVLGPGCRIDFLTAEGVGVEVKRGRTWGARVTEQCLKYMRHDRVRSLVLVSEKSVRADLSSPEIRKPAAVVCCAEQWGIAT